MNRLLKAKALRMAGSVALLALLALFVGRASGQAGESGGEPSPAALFSDFLHYSVLGRFELADSQARQLLNHPDLDPVEIHRLSVENKRSVETLLTLIRHSSIAESASRVMDVIREGERMLREDADRIRANVEKLGGTPQEEHFAILALVDSGEYAIPAMIQTLGDERRKSLWPRIIRALPRIGAAAVRPLVECLEHDDTRVALLTAEALGALGYLQAAPYLMAKARDAEVVPDVRAAAASALSRIEMATGRPMPPSAVDGFVWLGGQYFEEEGAGGADARLAEANIWYWDESTQLLESIAVPTSIFGSVMAMRCCERALSLSSGEAGVSGRGGVSGHDGFSGHDGAVALWLASNIRRESRLGLDVESDDVNAVGTPDPSRPADTPRALYFTRAAGPRFAQMALHGAVRNGDTQVALGAIAALRSVGGASSMMGSGGETPALVAALSYPDTVVRVRAAVALAQAAPETVFAGSERVVPILGAAAGLTGWRHYVVIDPDQGRMNALVNELRDGRSTVIGEGNAYSALERARAESPRVSGIFLSTALASPSVSEAIEAIRRVADTSRTPILLIADADDRLHAERLAGAGAGIGVVDAGSPGDVLVQRLDEVAQAVGQTQVDDAKALALAMEATAALGEIAVNGASVFDAQSAQGGLMEALKSADAGLRQAAIGVLAYLSGQGAQLVVAGVALDERESEAMRLAAFSGLSESARRFGSYLGEEAVANLSTIAFEDPNLTLRTAAGEALGALNRSADVAGEIVLKYRMP